MGSRGRYRPYRRTTRSTSRAASKRVSDPSRLNASKAARACSMFRDMPRSIPSAYPLCGERLLPSTLPIRSRCCCRSSSTCSRSRCAASCRRTGSRPGRGRGPRASPGRPAACRSAPRSAAFGSPLAGLVLGRVAVAECRCRRCRRCPLPPAAASSAIFRARTSSLMMPSSSCTSGRGSATPASA